MCWGDSPHPTPPAPAAEKISLIKALADVIITKRKDPLPETKLSQISGDPVQWREWYGQFESAIYSQSLTHDVKLTYLKSLITGKTKTATAEFAYRDAIYRDAHRTVELKFNQPQAVLSAHLDMFRSFPPLKMHISDKFINFSGFISSIVAIITETEDSIKPVTKT